MDFLGLFLVAFMPVLKVLLVTAVGLLLATDRINLLGPASRNHLNNLVFYVFSPALIGSSLADTITLNSLSTLWFMPVNILLTFLIGSALGWMLIKLMGTPHHLRGLVISCCAAGNIGSLLLIILPALCEESNSPFGDSTDCSAYGEAYAALSMAVLAIYIWTYVYFIMQLQPSSTQQNGSATEALLSQATPSHAVVSEDGMKEQQSPLILDKFRQCIAKINLRRVLAPSTIAAIVGFGIGIASPVRKMLIGNSAPLGVIYSSAELLGEAAIPSITLIVGANLLRGLNGGSGARLQEMIGVILVRFAVLPPIGILVVKGAQHYGLLESNNSLYEFTLLVQYAVPPAMNIGTIVQLVKRGETECSVIMLLTYAVASLSLTLWSAFFMWLVS